MARKLRNADDFGNWAYDARNALGLSTDEVAKALGYDRTGIVRAEGRQRSAAMELQLPAYLQRVARERGTVLPPVPGAKPEQPAPQGDMAQLIAAMTRQSDLVTDLLSELRAERQERASIQAQLDELRAKLRGDAAQGDQTVEPTPAGQDAPEPAVEGRGSGR